ncbi:MAG: DUF3833 family protein [Pseudomonadota bacterium]
MIKRLRLEDFFDRPTTAYGVFQDRFSRPRRLFEADVLPTFKQGLLTLEEHFTFDDGVREERIWKIRPEGRDAYRATANGVIGEAIGMMEGNALHWHYTFALDIGPRVLNVQFDDWMCPAGEATLINRATIRKWGVRIGELTLVFVKPPIDS